MNTKILAEFFFIGSALVFLATLIYIALPFLMAKMRKIAGTGSEIQVDFGSKGVKDCIITQMGPAPFISVRLMKGKKIYKIRPDKVQL